MEKRPCPICKKKVDPKSSRYLPFCSERCKKIDLGRWALEKYRIPGGPAVGGPADEKKSVDDEEEKEEE